MEQKFSAKPDVDISFDEYLSRLHLSERSFRKRLDLPIVGRVKRVLPLKNIRNVDSIIPLPNSFLFWLLENLKTMSGELPFKNARFELMKFDPVQLRIGQKFAYRENYVELLESVADIFRKKHAINSGVTNLGAFMIFGRDDQDQCALAYYLPPLVEEHNQDLVIMDGIHRDYLTLQMGATITAVRVRDIKIPFPCSAHKWDELKVISLRDKPQDINERYFDLRKDLFRDLKYLGIDG